MRVQSQHKEPHQPVIRAPFFLKEKTGASKSRALPFFSAQPGALQRLSGSQQDPETSPKKFPEGTETNSTPLKTFTCPDFKGDAKLEACLNDKDRLAPGEISESVTKVQRGLKANLTEEELREHNIELKTDGKYGDNTGRAVKLFKKKHKLGFEIFPDVGPGTMKKLDELCKKEEIVCPPCTSGDIRPVNCPVCLPNLPDVPTPDVPPGPVIPPGSPGQLCVPFPLKIQALATREAMEKAMIAFILNGGFGSEVEDLWLKYLNNPKSGTKGTLPPRKVFDGQNSRIVQAFQQDPETKDHMNQMMLLIADRVKNKPELMPPPGKATELLDLRVVLKREDLLDRQMSFKEPGFRIPGLIAGGPAKGNQASDAGDDVRNVAGTFIFEIQCFKD